MGDEIQSNFVPKTLVIISQNNRRKLGFRTISHAATNAEEKRIAHVVQVPCSVPCSVTESTMCLNDAVSLEFVKAQNVNGKRQWETSMNSFLIQKETS